VLLGSPSDGTAVEHDSHPHDCEQPVVVSGAQSESEKLVMEVRRCGAQ
jgi:hypothetical protein